MRKTETIVMAKKNDPNGEALLQQVIEHLQRQEIPEFPDPDLSALTDAKTHVSSVRTVSLLRRVTMNRRFQLSAGAIAGLAAMLGFVLLWGGNAAQSVSAMEKMAESIRKAKSFKAAVVLGKRPASETGTPPGQCFGALYWLATGSWRLDLKGKVPYESPSEQDRIQIHVAGKPWMVFIDRENKRTNKCAMPKQREPDGPDIIEKLSEFSGHADRDLGVKDINGKKAHGFEIDMNKIITSPNRDVSQPKQMAEVWIDPESSLPVLVQFNYSMSQKQTADVLFFRLQEFQWNIDLDPNLFDTTPPKGYTDTTPREPSVEERVRWFTESLRLYTELTGGRDYPQASTMVEADAVHKELSKKFQPKADLPERAKDETFQKSQRAAGGIIGIASLVQFLNPDAAYYGKTVKPGDKDKVLLRWKLDDGRYEVIYGDLRAETVTADKLRALEANQGQRKD
jgi:hypothetical protein